MTAEKTRRPGRDGQLEIRIKGVGDIFLPLCLRLNMSGTEIFDANRRRGAFPGSQTGLIRKPLPIYSTLQTPAFPKHYV
jgi:hypothetical protein